MRIQNPLFQMTLPVVLKYDGIYIPKAIKHYLDFFIFFFIQSGIQEDLVYNKCAFFFKTRVVLQNIEDYPIYISKFMRLEKILKRFNM